MKISHRLVDDIYVFDIIGDFFTDDSEKVEHYIQPFLQDDGVLKILFNCEQVDYIDSFGMGLLVHAHKELGKRRGFFGICNPNDTIMDVLESVGLNSMLNFYATEADAVMVLNKSKTN